MGKYIRKRLLMMVILLLGMTFIVFASLYIAPGDPAELAACTADVRRSYDYAKWLQLTSKVEHSHSQNYAAYSH